jgi:pimeloyl-ACP methyl ester carboxylesterase
VRGDGTDSTGTIEGAAGSYEYRRLGEGEPLLLLNGYAATSADWDPSFLRALAADRTLICPNHRGMGGSALGDERLTVELMAADVLALMDALALEAAPVAGWSMGGFVAQAVARAAPDRVGRLVLLATDPGGPAAIHGSGSSYRRLVDHTGSPEEQASRLISLLFPPEVATAVERDFGDVVAAARAALSHDALSAQEAAMAAWATGPQPGPLPVPVLAAAGELDEIIPAENSPNLAVGGGDWLARFPGCGHAFMAQQPRRVAALISAFLSAEPGDV